MLQHVTLLFLHKIFVSYSLLGMFFLADVNLGSDISSYYGVIQMCVSPLLYREKSGLCVCVSVCVGCVCVCVCVCYGSIPRGSIKWKQFMNWVCVHRTDEIS
jgi:hypothetical protein